MEQRVIATVMFTDIVGSTERLAEVGDQKWRSLLQEHHEIVRNQLKAFQGREIATAGDGFLAIFDRPGWAIHCASAIRDAVKEVGLEIRAGVHMGVIEQSEDDVAGIAVHIAARVQSIADPSEVFVSGTVRDAEFGSGFGFEDRGKYELKGVPGEWTLFAVTSIPEISETPAESSVEEVVEEVKEQVSRTTWTGLEKGQTIGRYKIDSLIGRGAMGEVYKATDPAIGRKVAIKIVRIDSHLFGEDSADELFARFQQEARSAGRLKHQNLVGIYDYGEEHGGYFLVMEYVEGVSLADRLSATGPLTPEEACATILQACHGLSAAHQKGVVHRDIKPANLMIEAETGLVKVLDFGVARLDASQLTQSGMVFGTPSYMSPEQVLGRWVDHRTDLFSLGAVFFELMTGNKPFGGDNMATVTYKVINEEPEGFGEVPDNIGEGYAYVVAKSMAKDQEQRFQSAAEMADAIQTYCMGAAASPGIPMQTLGSTTAAGAGPGMIPSSAPITPPAGIGAGAPRKSRTALMAAALVTVIGLGGGAGWYYFLGPGAAARTTPPSAEAGVEGTGAAAQRSGVLIQSDPETAAITIDDSLSVTVGETLWMTPGRHSLQATNDGFAPLDTTVAVLLGEVTTLTLDLVEAEPVTGTLDLVSNVPGSIFMGNRRVGATPRRGFEIGAGTYTFRFVPDGAPSLEVSQRVTVQPERANRAEFSVTQGLLTVGVQSPNWATVIVDGRRVGDTPLIEHKLSSGAHRLRVERDGYAPAERTVRIEAAQHERWVGITLSPSGGSSP